MRIFSIFKTKWHLYMVGLLIAFFTACYSIQVPEGDELTRNVVMSTIYAYQFDNNCSSAQWNTDYFYLQYKDANPPEYVFVLLQKTPIKLRRYSQAIIPSDRNDYITIQDFDHPKKRGIIFRIDSLDIYKDSAFAIGGYYEGKNSFSRESYELKAQDSAWVITKQKTLLLQ